MPADFQTAELSAVVTELGPAAQVHGSDAASLTRSVTGSVVWLPGSPLPDDASVMVVCAALGDDPDADLAPLLAATPPLMVAICRPTEDVHSLGMATSGGAHGTVILTVAANASHVVTAVARSTQTAEQAVSVRLGSLQRSLSLALADPAPIPALLDRVKKVCNATAVLIDRRGELVHATGPVPRALLFDELSSTRAGTQSLSIDGWNGLAARIADADAPDEHTGWLVVTSRRTNFPDAHVRSAVHVAASLIEASQRMQLVVRQQERAVRAAVLEQALALRYERRDPELAARIAGLGIDFSHEVRLVLVSFATAPRSGQRQQAGEQVMERLGQMLATAGHPALLTARAEGVAVLAQCSVTAVQRLLAGGHKELPPLLIGIGRPLSSVDAVVDSYHDAQLAIRTLRQVAPQQWLMAYEDFDFATRLFSDVGLDRMVAWAEDFLRPLVDRENLLDGLRAYFDHDQNINLAAESLSIHHNSLRYRLGKVEEALAINLKQPAAVSSLFLALTAIDLTRRPGALRPRGTPDRDGAAVGDVDATGVPTSFSGGPRTGSGVVRGSD
jgi:sugar diacid utilization regulator